MLLFFDQLTLMIVYFRDLSWNNLRGEIPTELGSLTNLFWLYDIFIFFSNYLDDSFFQGFVFKRFKGWNTNRIGIFDQSQLAVWHIYIFHQFTLMIVDFRDLSSNSLTGEIPTQLGSLTNLNWLYGIWHISFFHHFILVIVDFRYLPWNNLAGEIPTELGHLTNLYYLYNIFIFPSIYIADCLFQKYVFK